MNGVIGFTTLFAGSFAPRGWAFCNGQMMPIQQNTALFSVLSNNYGGNGVSTFALPNLQGRAAVGSGQGPGLSAYGLGQIGGSEVSTITGTQLPSHTHELHMQLTPNVNGTPNTASPDNAVYATSQSSLYNYTSDTVMQSYTGTLTLGNTGYNPKNAPPPIPTLHPVLGLNYIICVQGVFPKRT
ncbi:MAG TPA: tail fiber protein [Puia sp.]|jgi:microcystin-dependent protein